MYPVTWIYVSGICMGYHEYVLGAVVQYICPIHIGRHSIHIPNTYYGCPIHMYKCSPRHIRTPIYMKICIGYMCWIASIYIGSHNICIGYMSWRTFVLPNTYEKVLSKTYGVLPKTYTQYIFRVPKTYLGTIQRKPIYVLGNTTYVSPVSIAA